jgi:hypothetical protein
VSEQPLILSKEAFMKVSLPEEPVTVEGLGTVRVRSLSRAEYMRIRTNDAEGWEIALVALCMVEPSLTEDEVREWRETMAAPKLFDDLAGEVLRVSGLRQTAVAEAKQSFPDNKGS